MRNTVFVYNIYFYTKDDEDDITQLEVHRPDLNEQEACHEVEELFWSMEGEYNAGGIVSIDLVDVYSEDLNGE